MSLLCDAVGMINIPKISVNRPILEGHSLDVLKNGFVLERDNPLREELFVMDEIIEIKKKYNIKQVIITHLEEDWGKSYDDYVELEKEYDGIQFAYDGMEVVL